jgi:hypothetical protein
VPRASLVLRLGLLVSYRAVSVSLDLLVDLGAASLSEAGWKAIPWTGGGETYTDPPLPPIGLTCDQHYRGCPSDIPGKIRIGCDHPGGRLTEKKALRPMRKARKAASMPMQSMSESAANYAGQNCYNEIDPLPDICLTRSVHARLL